MQSLGQTIAEALKDSKSSLNSPQIPPIRPYSGNRSENLTAFIFQISDVFDSRRLPLEDRLKAVTGLLSDSALQWYLQRRSDIQAKHVQPFATWDAFIGALRAAFEPSSTPMALRRQLRHLKQTGHIQDYICSFRNIIGQIKGMHPLDQVLSFTEGLKEHTRNELVYRDPSSLEEAINLATLFDSCKFPRGNTQHNRQTEQSLDSQSSYTAMEIGSVKKTPRDKRKKCSFCNFFGHEEKECRKKQASSGGSPSVKSTKPVVGTSKNSHANSIDLECNSITSNHLLYVMATLEETPIIALVDSGASHNFVRAGLFQEENEELNKKFHSEFQDQKAQLVDGTPAAAIGLLKNANLTVGKLKDKLTAHAIHIANYDLILGKPWLFKHNPSIDWKENRMEIAVSRDCIIINGEKAPTSRTRSQPAPMLIASRKEVDSSAEMICCYIANEIAGNAAPKSIKDNFVKVFEPLRGMPPERRTKHQIKVTSNDPIALPAYRMGFAELKMLKDHLDDLMEKGFIQPSGSSWSSPVLFVKKKDGSHRLCVDYRALNRITVKHRYPIPRIEDLLDQLSEAKIFSKLDLQSGYYQVQIDPDDTQKTAFKTRYGLFEFKVMPFGLTNAPATFQKLMNEIFHHELDRSVVVYLDDILVFSNSEEEHLDHLQNVFKKLSDNNLFVKESKCQFYLKRVEFLGYVVGGGKIEVDKAKIACIERLASPTNLTSVRAFLGMTGFYRRFIEGYAEIVYPLTELLKDNSVFSWGNQEETAVQYLKQKLSEAPILSLPNQHRLFTLSCDASGRAIAGVLAQPTNDAANVIAFESRKLSKEEVKYPVYELELLAIIHCLKIWKCYLMGVDFIIYTDHASLKYIQTQKVLSPRVTRWLDLLSQFSFKIEYRPGKENVVADALSRLEINSVEQSDWPSAIPEFLSSGKINPKYHEFSKLIAEKANEFVLENETLYYLDGTLRVPYIPFHMRADLVCKVHCGLGHLGIDGTTNLIKTRGWWPGWRNDVKSWVQGCITCQKNSSRDTGKTETLHPIKPSLPFRRWGIDFIGRLPLTQRGNKWIIVAVDHCTRWPVAEAVSEATTKVVANFLYNHIFMQFGAPDEILSDRGANFMAEALAQYLQLVGVRHLRTSAYHPRCNGLVERFNGVLSSIIRKHCDENPKSWDLYVPQALFACRVRLHATTGTSPFYLTYGVEPKLPGDPTNPQLQDEYLDPAVAEEWRQQQITKLQLERKEAIERYQQQQEISRKAFAENVTKDRYTSGELVLLRKENRTKYDALWSGPYRIREIGENGIYKLADLNGKQLEDWVHGDRLKQVARMSDDQISGNVMLPEGSRGN